MQARSALRFGVGFVLLLALLLWPWPGLGHAFAGLVSEVVNVAADAARSSRGSFHFQPEGPADSWNAIVTLAGGHGEVQAALWELRRTPYLPMAVFAALALAFPFGDRKRRLAVLGGGLVLLALLPSLRLLLLLEADTPFRLFELPGALRSLLMIACSTLVLPPGMAFALPFLLWLLLLWIFDRAAVLAAARAWTERSTGELATPAGALSSEARGLPRRSHAHQPSKRARKRARNRAHGNRR